MEQDIIAKLLIYSDATYFCAFIKVIIQYHFLRRPL